MRKRRPTADLVIDGQEVKAFEGESVLDAARRAGIEIPTLCHLDGLSEVGSCRLCVVEVAEQRGLRPACATKITPEMVVQTNTPKLRAHRRMIVEMLFAEGNHVCSVCVVNGRCELQNVAKAVGMDAVRLSYQAPKRSVDASHPRYVYDPNRCVLCTRCVRTCAEIEGAHVWDVAHRGENACVVTDLGGSWGESTLCTRCGKCVAVCPTGALYAQHSGVGEARHNPDLIARLVAARRDHEWLLPEPPATSDPLPTATIPAPAPAVVIDAIADGPPAVATEPGPVRLATVWLGGCAGCHMSLLDLDEALIDLASKVDLVYSPLVDVKTFPTDVDIVVVEGAVTNEENREMAHTLRERSKVVVSLGDCAINGNVTAMRNPLGDPQEVLEMAYVKAVTRDGVVPHAVVPTLLPKALPLHQVIRVDGYLYGCPPSAQRIGAALTALVDDVMAGGRNV